MTAEEYYTYKYDNFIPTGRELIDVKEYAKLKCQELLLLVAENVYAQVEYDCAVVDKDSILNAVDLETFCS